MDIQDILLLYRYNAWANDRMMSFASGLSHEQFTAPAAFPHAGLRSTLVHILSAEWIWRNRWQGVSPRMHLDPLDFPTFSFLCTHWREERRALMTFIETLTDQALLAPLDYVTTDGSSIHAPALWPLMVHVVNHGTQHRSEAAVMLTDFGHSPGNLDLTTFLREI